MNISTESINCPNCGASLHVVNGTEVIECSYCHASIQLTKGFLEHPTTTEAIKLESLTGLSEDDRLEIHDFLQDGERLLAIKLIREKTGIGLAEAVDVVDAIKSDVDVKEGVEKADLWGCIKIPLAIVLWGGFLLGGTFFTEWILRSIFHFSRSSNTSAAIITSTPWLLIIVSVIIILVWSARTKPEKTNKK
jgi:LSD1 subclass zinc finger protein